MLKNIKHNTGTVKMNVRICGLWLAALAMACAGVRAQWVAQTVVVHEGWNAVALQAAPEGGALKKFVEDVGEGNVEGIWRWDKRFSAAEFVVDEGSPLAMDDHWKVWYPGEELGALSTLGGLSGGQCYLVKVKEGAGAKTVEIKGKARLPRVEWYPNALNLVGGTVGEKGVSFEEWFEADPAVDLSKGYGNHAWQIAADGSERVVSSPGVQKLSAGEAVWVRCNGASSYAGPLAVSVGNGSGLDFGAGLMKMDLSVENLSATRARNVELRLAASEEAPEGEEQVAGGVPLYLAEGGEWKVFSGKSVELGPGGKWSGTFGVNRAEMQWREELAETNSSYQSVLQVRDAEGKIAIDVPVRAVREASEGAGESIDDVPASVHAQAGLWTGTARLTAVNCPSYQRDEALPVRYAADLRLVVHVSGEGKVRLLKEAWVAEAAGTNGGMAIYARRELVPAGATNVWRASTATLPEMAPLALGTNGLAGTLSGTVELAYDDPVNPFLHRYHPMFDNKNEKFEAYDEAKESRNVSREIRLVVGRDGDGGDSGDNGDSGDGGGVDVTADTSRAVTGTYQEKLTGLRAQEILVKGTFALEKVIEGELVESDE